MTLDLSQTSLDFPNTASCNCEVINTMKKPTLNKLAKIVGTSFFVKKDFSQTKKVKIVSVLVFIGVCYHSNFLVFVSAIFETPILLPTFLHPV